MEERAEGFEIAVLVGRNRLTETDDGVRFRECVEVVVAEAFEDADAPARRHRDGMGVPGYGSRRAGRTRREHARAHGCHLRVGRAVNRGNELAAERGLPGDEAIAFALELDRVAGEARAQPGRNARRHLAAPSRRSGENRPRVRAGCAFDDGAGHFLLDVLAGVVRDVVGAPCSQPVGVDLVDEGEGQHVPGQRGGRAKQLARLVKTVGLDDHHRQRLLRTVVRYEAGRGRGFARVAERAAFVQEPDGGARLFRERCVGVDTMDAFHF